MGARLGERTVSLDFRFFNLLLRLLRSHQWTGNHSIDESTGLNDRHYDQTSIACHTLKFRSKRPLQIVPFIVIAMTPEALPAGPQQWNWEEYPGSPPSQPRW